MMWVYNQDFAAYGDVLTPFPGLVAFGAAALLIAAVLYGLFID